MARPRGRMVEKNRRGDGTHDVGTMDHPHLTPHALLIPLDFLLRHGHQYDLTRYVPRHRLGGGISRGREVAESWRWR
jgi:hypothetical protein